MKRRELLEVGAAGALASVFPTALAGATSASLPKLVLREDGSFDVLGRNVGLEGCWPAFDDVPVRARAVSIERTGDGGRIRYELAGARALVLTLARTAGGAVSVSVVLEGFSEAPHWVYPLAGAKIVGADRFFKQGLGFGGPSGLHPLPASREWHDPTKLLEGAWSFDSFVTAAVVAPSGETLAIGAVEHRDFLQRTTFYNRTHRKDLVEKRAASDVAFLEAGFGTERVPVDRRLVLPALEVSVAARPWDALRGWATRVARANDVRPKPPQFHWDSWYEYMEGYDAGKLDDLVAGLRGLAPRLPFRCLLIDAGYAPLGELTAADERLYPGGFPAAFDKIRAAGYEPGLWVGPFMVSSLSRVFREHPDWVLRGGDGKPLVRGKGRPYFWQYDTYEQRMYLDTSHPAAFEHLRRQFRQLRAWGVRAFKADFLEWGFHDSTTVKRHTPGKTSVQYFTDVQRMIREEIGPDAYWLGCIAPIGPMIGFADGFRVGYDVDTDSWREGGNTINMFNETVAGQYMNNVLWHNDPDVVYVRDGMGGTKMTADEIRSLTLWNGILGGVVATSDRPHRLPASRLALLRFVQPGSQAQTARFPLWDKASAKGLVAVREYPAQRAFAVLVLNAHDDELVASYACAELVGARSPAVWTWGPEASDVRRLGRKGALDVKLARHQSALFWVSDRDAAPPRGFGLGGERVPGLG